MGDKVNIIMQSIGSTGIGILSTIKNSPFLGNIYVITNNPTLYNNCEIIGNYSNTKFKDLKSNITKHDIGLAILCNDFCAVSSYVDYYKEILKVPTIGTTYKWFLLEGSKLQGKEFFKKHNILMPEYLVLKNNDEQNKEIDKIIEEYGFPLVIKLNKLEAGFGSYIIKDEKEFRKKIKFLFKTHKFCIIEKFIKGKELSQQYLWDTKTLVPLLPVRDYKKAENNDKGINTGSLGSYTPIEMTKDEQALLDKYNKNIAEIFEEEKPDFTGIFTANLLYTKDRMYTLEFNMRPGIPEFETLIEHLDCDFLEILIDCANKKLDASKIKYKEGTTVCVSVCHKKYLKQKGKKAQISLKRKSTKYDNDIKINYNTNTYFEKNNKAQIYTSCMIFSALNTAKNNPQEAIYQYLSTFEDKNLYYRTDIYTTK